MASARWGPQKRGLGGWESEGGVLLLLRQRNPWLGRARAFWMKEEHLWVEGEAQARAILLRLEDRRKM